MTMNMWNRLKERVTGIINFGLTPGISVGLSKRIRLSNILASLAAITMVLSVPLSIQRHDTLICWIDLATALIFAWVPVLNYLKFYKLSRLLYVITGNLFLLCFGIVFGESGGFHLAFFALIGIPQVLFEEQEKKLLYGLSTISVLAFVFLKVLIFPYYRVEPAPAAHYWYSTFSTFIFIGALLFYFRSENSIAESKLEEVVEQFEEAQTLMHLGSWSYDVKTKHFYWSDEMYRLYGI